MIALKLEALFDHLKKSHDAKLQEENKQISIILKIADYDVPLFVGVLHDALVQFIAYLPFEMKQDKMGDVALFLHSLNKDFDLPGFGMDAKEGLMFYRVVIPCLKPEVDAEMLDAHLRTVQIACQTVLEGIKQAEEGGGSIAQAARTASVAERLKFPSGPKKA